MVLLNLEFILDGGGLTSELRAFFSLHLQKRSYIHVALCLVFFYVGPGDPYLLISFFLQNKHLTYWAIFPSLNLSCLPFFCITRKFLFSVKNYLQSSTYKTSVFLKTVEEFLIAVHLVECASCRCLHSSSFLSVPLVFQHLPHNLHEGCVLHLL